MTTVIFHSFCRVAMRPNFLAVDIVVQKLTYAVKYEFLVYSFHSSINVRKRFPANQVDVFGHFSITIE